MSEEDVRSEIVDLRCSGARPEPSDITHPPSHIASPLPLPRPNRPDLNIRLATAEDLPFIDALQKRHSRMVGWFPTKQLEAYVNAGNVLIAEEGIPGGSAFSVPGSAFRVPGFALGSQPGTPNPKRGTPAAPLPGVGYCIARDRYSGRDDVGIIYQLNVAPGRQRSLVGATLVREVFARAAYGCRLFSLWCAQDLEANRFWESLGFVPLAFRAGSRGKRRIHIFWQRRVRAGDEDCPYWFPAQTRNGAVREDRLVLPIPPGAGWRDAKPAIFPEMSGGRGMATEEGGRLSADGGAVPPSALRSPPSREALAISRSRHLRGLPPGKAAIITGGKLRYVDRAAPSRERAAPPRRVKERKKADPRHVAAARELRDRYLEHMNAGMPPGARLGGAGKYDISRAPADAAREPGPFLPLASDAPDAPDAADAA